VESPLHNLGLKVGGIGTLAVLTIGLGIWVRPSQKAVDPEQKPTLTVDQMFIQNLHLTPGPPPFPPAPARLGMRTVYLSDPALPVGIDVEFRIRLLSGRPASSLSFDPVWSKQAVYSIRFSPISFLLADQEAVVEFEVWRFDVRPSRKVRMLAPEWGKRLAEFVGDSFAFGNERGIETSPLIVKFWDQNNYRQQRFRLWFDHQTYRLEIADELPLSGISTNLDT
jgi:hypothetical protein